MSKWEMVRLGDVAQLKSGNSLSENIINGIQGIPYIKVAELNMNENIPFVTTSIRFVDDDFDTKQIFPSGCVIFPKRGGAIGTNKKRLTKCPIVADLNIMGVIPSSKLLPEYLYYYFQGIDMKTLENGSSVPQINNGDIAPLQIPLPPLEEQKKIATILDKASALIALRKQQIAKMDVLVKSRFIEMFGDPVTNPMGWEKVLLKKTSNIVTGNTPPRNDIKNYGDYIEWIKTDNITSKMYLTFASEYLSEKGAKIGRIVPSNSILMACIAGSIRSIGRVAISNREVAFNQQINAIIPEKYELYFLYHVFKLSDKYIQSTINMSLKGILSKGKLETLKFILPPLPLQEKFADFVSQAETQKAVMQKGLENLELQYKALMQGYFEG